MRGLQVAVACVACLVAVSAVAELPSTTNAAYAWLDQAFPKGFTNVAVGKKITHENGVFVWTEYFGHGAELWWPDYIIGVNDKGETVTGHTSWYRQAIVGYRDFGNEFPTNELKFLTDGKYTNIHGNFVGLSGDGNKNSLSNGDYLMIDLGEVTKINNVTVLFYTPFYAPRGMDISVWSDVKEDWVPVVANGKFWNTDGTTGWTYDSSGVTYDFDCTPTQFVRIDNIHISNAGWIFTQVMVMNYQVPEPATMSLLALGGLAMLRRRK